MANLLNNRFTTNTYNQLYPGLNKSNYDKVIAYGNSLGIEDEEEKKRAENAYYRKNVNKMVNDQILDERDDIINQQAYQAATINTKEADIELKKTELSQSLKRKYDLNAKANDEEVFNAFAEGLNDDGKKLLAEYLDGKSDEFLKVAGLEVTPKKEEKKVEKAEENNQYSWFANNRDNLGELGVGVLQSPGKRGYNILGQWSDRAGKYLADKLDGTIVQDVVQDLAKMTFGEDEVRKYQNEIAKKESEGTLFNGREATDIRTPILGEERANSGWTKAGETIGDIASGIALTAPIGAALAPTIAGSGIGGAAGIGALEGVADTALTQLGSEGNLDLSASQVLLGAGGGAAGGLLTRYLANLPAKQVKDIKKEAQGYIEKSIRPTVKGKQSQGAYNKFMDDTLDVVDWMSKNKEVLEYTDDAGEVVKGQLPSNLNEAREAFGNMKKYAYDMYNNIAKQSGDVGAKVNLNKVFDQLDDLASDTATNIANPGLKNIIEGYKNQLLQYSDDLGRIEIGDAQKLTQQYNKILDAYLKNPGAYANDTSRNIVIAQMNNGVKEAIDDSIDNALTTAINNGSKASDTYRYWKQLYGKIKTVEDELSKSALREMRKNSKGLATQVIDAIAGKELVEGILTKNPTGLVKSIAMKGVDAYNKYLNSPNTQLNNLFNLVDRINNPSAFSATLANKVGNNWTPIVGGVTNSIEEIGNVASNS